jgi:peptidoglycan hydrolase-like protein with peptidoglycan-binding domain
MNYPGLLKIGSKNAAGVKALKQRLNQHGNTLDITNGNFGASTEQAVKKYQRDKQLLADGIVGELTWSRLFSQSTPAQASTGLSAGAVKHALTQLHVREKTGKNDGAEVEEYLRYVGLAKGYAWCMAFVYWAFQKAAEDLNQANPLKKTGGVLAQWNSTPLVNRVTKPQPGDIFIMDFGKGTGHAGIVTSVVGDKIFTVEGNTSGQPTSAAADRDGQGVYERSRLIKSINKGFIRF